MWMKLSHLLFVVVCSRTVSSTGDLPEIKSPQHPSNDKLFPTNGFPTTPKRIPAVDHSMLANVPPPLENMFSALEEQISADLIKSENLKGGNGESCNDYPPTEPPSEIPKGPKEDSKPLTYLTVIRKFINFMIQITSDSLREIFHFIERIFWSKPQPVESTTSPPKNHHD